ncbi:hypothetical protein BDF19DRAFT_446954, partial [Syncephalis fuscata]
VLLLLVLSSFKYIGVKLSYHQTCTNRRIGFVIKHSIFIKLKVYYKTKRINQPICSNIFLYK